ncbi:MAG: class I SAM-dependent methyltransferase [Candidatus Nucleicultricaceae bacterium]|jgi:SAM-dependent methyltransferase
MIQTKAIVGASIKKSTLNGMGYTNTEHNPALDAFLLRVEETKGTFADIGAAFGYASIAALKRGGKVVAIDLDEGHLDELMHNTPEHLRDNLVCKVGHFPNNVKLPDSSFDGILMAKVLLFYTAEEIEAVLRTVYALLKPGGCFYVTSPSPFRKSLEIYRAQYETQREQGNAWPGRVYDYTKKFPSHQGQLPDELQFIDETSLYAGLSEAGFKVMDMGYWPLDNHQRREAFDVVYAIAEKSVR